MEKDVEGGEVARTGVENDCRGAGENDKLGAEPGSDNRLLSRGVPYPDTEGLDIAELVVVVVPEMAVPYEDEGGSVPDSVDEFVGREDKVVETLVLSGSSSKIS